MSSSKNEHRHSLLSGPPEGFQECDLLPPVHRNAGCWPGHFQSLFPSGLRRVGNSHEVKVRSPEMCRLEGEPGLNEADAYKSHGHDIKKMSGTSGLLYVSRERRYDNTKSSLAIKAIITL